MNTMEAWEPVMQADDVPDNGVVLAWKGEDPVALYRLGDRYYATSDNCTHGSGSLSEGFVCGENIECPMHQGLFHIPTGKAVGVPCIDDVKCYEVLVENGTVYLKA